MVAFTSCILAAVEGPGSVAEHSALELETLVDRLLVRLLANLSAEVPDDISLTAASTLRILLEEGPQRVTRLAQREQVAQPTMSVILKRLEQRGLVERRTDMADRRATLVVITGAGVDAMRRRNAERRRWFARRLAELEGEDRASIAVALERLLTLFE